MKIHFATTNRRKLAEAAAILAPLGHRVLATRTRPVEIQAATLEEVAHHKAESIRGRVEAPFFVEDAGLFVRALKGFPGVYSAQAFATIGTDGILKLLSGRTGEDRHARFESVIAFVDRRGRLWTFRGHVEGRIAQHARGRNGFGFDPIFVAGNGTRTFAELEAGEKDRLSHRGHALGHLGRHLARG